MHISKITIENFKSIEKLDIYPNEYFNVIIGENNQGKTTIFEALQLWHRCYKRYIQTNGKDFYTGDNLYLPFKDLNFLRLTNDIDLFQKAPNICKIGLTLRRDDQESTLTFEISRPKVIANAYYRIRKAQKRQFQNFAANMRDKGLRLTDAIFIYQTSPVSSVLANEPFMNKGQVTKKIVRGKSQEVLRNKIRYHSNPERLRNQISEVLDRNVSFNLKNGNRLETDEYINLQVREEGRELDLYLQGSGLLQVAEIFATIDYLDAELNILLIDEPDSHIHAALQRRLLGKMKELEGCQTFIISHNDVFVSQVENGELFYLNRDAKVNKKLEPVEDFDLIKQDFGSPILSLEKLNEASRIVFVEGSDDITNIKALFTKYQESGLIANSIGLNKCQFLYIRGRDDLVAKMEHNRRTLSQLFRNKIFVVLTDKDFANRETNEGLNMQIQQRLGNGSLAFSHDAYCLEATLFSNLDTLFRYLHHRTAIPEEEIRNIAETYLDELRSSFGSVTSDIFSQLNEKFRSQQKNRPELQNMEFANFAAEACQDRMSLRYIMNKSQIRSFIEKLETDISMEIVERTIEDTDEDFCGRLFSDYVSSIPQHGLIFDEHKGLLNRVYGIEIA